MLARITRRIAIASVVLLGATAWSHAAEDKQDVELRNLIETRLAALPELEGTEIQVAVRDGQVVLRGNVVLLEQSLRALQTAWKTPGVLDVDNELRVGVDPPTTGADVAIDRHVREIVRGDPRFADTQLDVEVSLGVVSVRGKFVDPSDVLSLKHRIAEIPGVREVRIDAHLVASVQNPRANAS